MLNVLKRHYLGARMFCHPSPIGAKPFYPSPPFGKLLIVKTIQKVVGNIGSGILNDSRNPLPLEVKVMGGNAQYSPNFI